MDKIQDAVFEYLQKYGKTNTFKLSHDLGIERYKLLNVLGRLKNQGVIAIERGNAEFIKSPILEKKPIVKKRKKKSIRSKLKKQLEDKEKYVGRLEKQIQTLQKKLKTKPKVITKIKREIVVKEVPKVIVKRVKEKIRRKPKKVRRLKKQKVKRKVELNLFKKMKEIKVPAVFKGR